MLERSLGAEHMASPTSQQELRHSSTHIEIYRFMGLRLQFNRLQLFSFNWPHEADPVIFRDGVRLMLMVDTAARRSTSCARLPARGAEDQGQAERLLGSGLRVDVEDRGT